MRIFITAPVVAHPDQLAVHIVGDDGLRSIPVGEDDEPVVAVLVGIVDGLLEGSAAASQDGDVLHHLLQGLDHLQARIELDDVHGGEPVAEGAVYDAEEVGEVPRGDGPAHVHGHEQFRVEAADGAHVLEPRPAVGAHPGEFPVRRQDAGPEAGKDVPPVDFRLGGRLELFGEVPGESPPVLAAFDDAVDHGDRELVLGPQLGQGRVLVCIGGELVGTRVALGAGAGTGTGTRTGTGVGFGGGTGTGVAPLGLCPVASGGGVSVPARARRQHVLDAAGVPLVLAAGGKVIVLGVIDVEVPELVVVADGDVAAHGDGLLGAGVGLPLVGVLQQNPDRFRAEGLLQGQVAHLFQEVGVVLHPPRAGAHRAGHRRVLLDAVRAQHLEERRLGNEPALQDPCDSLFHLADAFDVDDHRHRENRALAGQEGDGVGIGPVLHVEVREVRRGLLLLLGEEVEVGFDVLAGLFLGRAGEFFHLQVAEDAVVHDRELVQLVAPEGGEVLLQVLEDFPPGEDLVGGNARDHGAGGFRAHDGRDGLGHDRRDLVHVLENVAHAFPAAAVRGLVEARVGPLLGVGVLVQPQRVLPDEVADAAVHAGLLGPQKPFLDGGAEADDIEPGHEGRVQVGELVLVAGVHRRDDPAALRQAPARQLAVECQVHDRLQDFRPGAVEFVQEQDDGPAVQREPVRRHELRLAGGIVTVGNADQVAWIGHLAEEQGDDRHPFPGEVLGEDLGLADSVIAHQHDVLVGGRQVQERPQLRRVDVYVCHSLYIVLPRIRFISFFPAGSKLPVVLEPERAGALFPQAPVKPNRQVSQVREPFAHLGPLGSLFSVQTGFVAHILYA